MQLHVKMITKVHPRGCTVTLDMPEGTSVGELMDYLLETEELKPYPDLFDQHTCVRRGMMMCRDEILSHGDSVTLAKLLSGG